MWNLLEHYMTLLKLDWARDQCKRCDDCPVGHPNSTHKAGTGQDYILYAPDMTYPHPDADNIYSHLHDFWDLIGGAERISGDLRHFSEEHNGVR
jgi:hypothetical protein